MILLETDRLNITKFTIDDAKEIYEFSQEDSMKQWIPNQVYANLEESKETLEFLMSKYAEEQFPLVYAVRLKDGTLIGHVGLSEINQGIEIGYAIGERFQGRGYATEAVLCHSDWGLRQFGLPVLYGVVKYENIASCKVLQKSGFVFSHDDIDREFDKETLRKIYIKGEHS